MTDLPIIARAISHGDRTAFRCAAEKLTDASESNSTQTTTYRQIVGRSRTLAVSLLSGKSDLEEARIGFLAPAGADYVAIQWAIWQAGGIAVPLSLAATVPELEYVLENSGADCIVTMDESSSTADSLRDKSGIRCIALPDVPGADTTALGMTLPTVTSDRRAMILYTSGTTSKPKGVVTTHAMIQSQIETLVEAWNWQADDSIPLFLPLHHIHGIINVLSCGLWTGAIIEPFPRFDLAAILGRVASNAYSVFMAVPTIYVKLIEHLEPLGAGDQAGLAKRDAIVAGFTSMRLMVSGSAALPASVHEHWTRLTGQKLLERYGMTEVGMALSNPYDGQRRPGFVGQPLPGVSVRLISDEGDLITGEGQSGEIQLRGGSVFAEYWRLPKITEDSFTDGWFRTGDVAQLEDGYLRILGRQSVDIIKSGGYKLSALEIETVLLDHPSIRQCAVVGIPDATWGEAVAVAVVLKSASSLDMAQLRTWCADRLSKYKIPKMMCIEEQLPSNAMGKVVKPAVADLFKPKTT